MPLLATGPLSTTGLLFISQYLCGTNVIGDFVFDGVDLSGIKIRANAFLWAYAGLSLFSLPLFFLSLLSMRWNCGTSLRTDRVTITFCQPCITDLLK